MATVTATADTFDALVDDNDIVLVDWWATWCGPCKQFGPIFEQASEDHTDITFTKVDVDAEPELAGRAGITHMPTLMAFREGILVYAKPGAIPRPALEQLISAVRELDMDQVRAQLAEQESKRTSA